MEIHIETEHHMCFSEIYNVQSLICLLSVECL